jgi:hypothetical protein
VVTGRAFEPTPARPARAAARSAVGGALALQRSAGNAAVGRLLARSSQTDTLKAMQATKGYQALSSGERARLDALVGGGTSVAAHAWRKMKALLAKRGTNKDVAATFQSFVSGKSWLNFDVRLPSEKRLAAAPFTTEGPTDVKDHPYRTGAADARKTVAKIQGTWPDGTKQTFSIPIYAPKSFTPPKPERVLPSPGDMAKVLAELPIQSLASIKEVNLNPKPNKDDATLQADPDFNPTGREIVSHMSASPTGEVNIYPSRMNASLVEIETALIHETGHTVSGTKWGHDLDDAKWDAWKRAMTADGISVSEYGATNANEDFGESWLLYVTAYGTPLEAEVRALIPNRAKLMDDFMQHKKPAAKAPAGAVSK